MKKWISLLLVLILLLSPVAAYAEDEGSIRHEVYGDKSEFEVSGELSQGKENAEQSQAQMSTDLYLFVDPDTASYVTFYVTDEEGEPIEGALIYIIYNNIKEFFGSTDENGQLKKYLFRNVAYGFEVKKSGYETATGTFYASDETKLVHVVLRKYYPLDVFVLSWGEPLENVTVLIEGVAHSTDEAGKASTSKVNGVYDVTVITPDGRYVHSKAVVDAGGRLIVDIGLDDSIVQGGLYNDRFLVYNKEYNPEDYVLTKYFFDGDDVPAEDREAYLSENINTIHVQAQPEREQLAQGDRDILDEDGNPLYAQRSLMPSGFLLKAWEEEGYEQLVFTNEEISVSIPMASLHSGDMMKLYGAVRYLSDSEVALEDIVTDKVKTAWNGYENTGLLQIKRWDLSLDKIDLNAVKPHSFSFEAAENTEVISDSYYINSMFEFRITPVLPEALIEMLRDGLGSAQSLPKDEIMLASWGYYSEEMRRWLADGQLSEAEYDELYAFMVDGKLSLEEIELLREKKAEGELSDAELEFILEAAAKGKLYRVSCWLMYNDIEVDISTLMDGMHILRSADELYEEISAEIKAENKKISEEELAEKTEAELLLRYDFMAVSYNEKRYIAQDYAPGELSVFKEPVLIKYLEEGGSFTDILSGKSFDRLTMDIREESITLDDKDCPWYRAYLENGSGNIEPSMAVAAEYNGNALVLQVK